MGKPAGEKEVSRFLGMAYFAKGKKKDLEYYLVYHLSSK